MPRTIVVWSRPNLPALSAKMRGMFRSFGRRPRLALPALETLKKRAYDLWRAKGPHLAQKEHLLHTALASSVNGLYHIQHKAAAITGDHPNGRPPRHLKDGASAASQRASPPKNGGWLVVWTPMFGHVPVLQYQYALRSTSFQALPYQDTVG